MDGHYVLTIMCMINYRTLGLSIHQYLNMLYYTAHGFQLNTNSKVSAFLPDMADTRCKSRLTFLGSQTV